MYKKARQYSATRVPGSVSVTASLVTIALGALITPQIILRAFPAVHNLNALILALLTGITVFVLVCVAVNKVTCLTPRRTTHQLATRFVGAWAGILVGAAKILMHGLLVLIGVELVVTAINAVVELGSWNKPLTVALVMVFTIPALFASTGSGLRWPRALAFVGVLALALVLVWGLVEEFRGAIDFKTIWHAQSEALKSDAVRGGNSPHLEAVLGACFPAAIALVVSERTMAVPQRRRVPIKRMLQVLVPMLLLIIVTMYFVFQLHLPAQRNSLPALSIAAAFFGETGHAILAVLFALTGLSVSVATYRQLPRLLRELAIDGLLSQRLAAEDAVVPRRMMVLLIAAVLAVISWILNSTRSFAMVFLIICFLVALILAISMIARSTSILHDSLDAQERRLARHTRWLYRIFGIIMIALLVLLVIVEPRWFIAALLSLAVPVIYLVIYRKGIGKLHQVLADDEAFAGRVIPTRVHSFVLVDSLDQPTLRALDWARASRGSSLQAICVDLDPARTRQLRRDWAVRELPVALTVVGTPSGAARGPVIEFVRAFRSTHPNDLVMVYYPKVISTGSWERFFIRHTTPSIISQLEMEPGVMVTQVPYRIDSADRSDSEAAGEDSLLAQDNGNSR